MRIEVVAAIRSREWSAQLDCSTGATVRQAVEMASRLDTFADAPLDDADGYAVWGQKVDIDHTLSEGDRVEVLRKLPNEPMDLRRSQAEDGAIK